MEDYLRLANFTKVEISEKLLKHYGWKTIEIKNNNKYDLKVEKKDKLLKLEIKECFNNSIINDVDLEFSYNGKLTGISVSESTHYIFKLHLNGGQIEYRLIQVDELKNMITKKLYRQIISDGNKFSYLFSLYVFREHSKILFQ